VGEEEGLGVDDEYSKAGIEDPRILITTSRNPSSKLLQFAKVCLFKTMLFRLLPFLTDWVF
jgi:U3 small nucleolar ribonucleoprotein protein IMP4